MPLSQLCSLQDHWMLACSNHDDSGSQKICAFFIWKTLKLCNSLSHAWRKKYRYIEIEERNLILMLTENTIANPWNRLIYWLYLFYYFELSSLKIKTGDSHSSFIFYYSSSRAVISSSMQKHRSSWIIVLLTFHITDGNLIDLNSMFICLI